MKFPYERYPTREGGYVAKPVIRVFLSGPFGDFDYRAIIDSGADFSMFSATEVGEGLLGLDVKSGKRYDLHGISGKYLEGYQHKIKIRVGGWEFEMDTVFAYGFNQGMGLLGRNDFFSLFKRICFKENEEEVIITPFR